MGRATRWLKGLFGIKNNKQDRHSADHPKRHSISRSCGDFDSVPRNISPVEATWLRSYCLEKRGQQSMHAMAVAAATAAAADAAVAAARAAVEVVRLTGHGRAAMINGRRGDESVAAVKIQTVFRGYLARKALRALKALVKLQALVRGYLVRKQAILTLKSMQALMRAQSTARSRRSNRLIKNPNDHQARPRKSMEMSSGTRDYEPRIRTHNRRMSAPIETSPLMKMRTIPPCSEAIMTVNGVDRHKPASRRKNNTSSVDFISIPYYPTASSPLPFQFSGHLSTASHIDFHQELEDEELPRCSSAQSTPRLGNSNGSGHKFFGQLSGHGFILPSYMADTQSSKAKLRSLSAPKQRPDVLRRLSLHEMMEISRNSLSGIRMQRSCSEAQEAINFKTAVMAKLDRYE